MLHKNPVMEWIEKHDIFMCREILAVELFKTKKKTTARAQLWQKVADNLLRYDTPVFVVTQRAVRDRYSVISTRYRKKIRSEEKASGIDVEESEIDVLLEELIEREKLSEEEGNEVKRKVEEEKCKATDVRKRAMESLGETNRRKDGDDTKGKSKKIRRSGSEAIEYLKSKSDQELMLKEREVELKKCMYNAEVAKNDTAQKKQDSLMQMLTQQQQQSQVQQQQSHSQMADFQLLMAQQNQVLMGLIEKLIPK